MVQVLTETRDTAKMFRDDADILAIRPSAAPANNRPRSPLLRADEDDGKPKSFDPNGDSDAAILLRRSGYRQTDEKTREGVYNVNEERAEIKVAERAAAAAAQAANQTLLAQAKSWMKSCGDTARRIANNIGETVSDITGYVSDKISNFGSSAADMLKSVKDSAANIASNIGSGINTYIVKPAGAAYDWAADKANTYIGKPAASAWSATKSFFGYGDDEPAAAKPAAAAPAAARPAPAAAAQPLAGQKNNVSSGLSLSSAWEAAGSAVDSVSDWWNGPSAKAAPAPRR